MTNIVSGFPHIEYGEELWPIADCLLALVSTVVFQQDDLATFEDRVALIRQDESEWTIPALVFVLAQALTQLGLGMGARPGHSAFDNAVGLVRSQVQARLVPDAT